MGGYRVKKPYPYVHEIRDRHGHLRAHLRKPGCPSVTLPLPIGSRAFVEAYQAALEVAPKIIGRTEFRCAQGCHTDCSVLMRLAILEGWRNDNPVSAVEGIKIKSDGHRTWTDEEIAAFEAFYPIGTEARLAFALLLYTGQRRSDVVRMGRQHIKNGFITIVQAKTKSKSRSPSCPNCKPFSIKSRANALRQHLSSPHTARHALMQASQIGSVICASRRDFQRGYRRMDCAKLFAGSPPKGDSHRTTSRRSADIRHSPRSRATRERLTERGSPSRACV